MKDEIVGLSNRILEVDLTKRNYTVYKSDDRDTFQYLGGKGLALKLFYDRFKPGSDPLGENNLLVFHTGAYMGTGAPCSGRFAAVAKSPLTGIISSSSCGGPFGMALRTSGYDGLILLGKSSEPLWLGIDSEKVTFNPASQLSGKDSEETTAFLEAHGSGSIVIGQAGENLVPMAGIVSGHRFLGRTGLGAVMGSKNVKGVVAKGKEFKILPVDPENFRKIRTRFIKEINQNIYTSVEYRNEGTASNVEPAIKNMMLPVNNFRDGTSPEWEKISGKTLKENHTEGFSTCKPCSIMCGHRGTFAGKKLQVPEYETIGLLGSSLGIFDPQKIAEWNLQCKLLGIDTISAGATLAWVMEATEKGIYESKLRFGVPDGISEALEDIAYAHGAGKELGMGTRWLSEKYGGSEFAIQSKGLEIAAYDPRGSVGHGLGLSTANRGGCHLSSTMMSSQAFSGFSFRFLRPGNPVQVRFFEDLYCTLNSVKTCQFTIYAAVGERAIVRLLPNLVIRIFMLLIPGIAFRLISIGHYYRLYNTVTGTNHKRRSFMEAGARIHTLERLMNCREGISSEDDVLPYRFSHEHRQSDRDRRVYNPGNMLLRYYRQRGYNSNGVPSARRLKRLGIKRSDV